jgi:hypothetical protein
MITQKQIEEIRRGLKGHHGSISRLIRVSRKLKKGGYSRKHIEQVLRGSRNNSELLTLAAELLATLNKERAEREAHLEEVLEQANSYA